jgi:hypothetical protein
MAIAANLRIGMIPVGRFTIVQQHLNAKADRLPALEHSPIDAATLELLATWQAQDATDEPAELRAAEQDLAEFKKAMNGTRARSGEPLLFP